jgi:hypothetical protein
MTFKHTPGPWACVPVTRDYGDGNDTLTWEIVGADGRKVVVLDDFHHPKEEVEADALLVATAPELLKACRLAIVALKGREHDGFLREVIAKATGSAA